MDVDSSNGASSDEDHPDLPPTTFWVDENSCRIARNKDNFNRALRSALETARRGSDRIRGPFDQLTADNFDKIFHTPITTAEAKREVKYQLGNVPIGVANFQELLVPETVRDGREKRRISEENRKKSNIRIYCDQDPTDDPIYASGQPVIPGTRRWRLGDDEPVERRPQSYIPNRQRPIYQPGMPLHRQYRHWYDEANGISTVGEGCRSRSHTGGVTYRAGTDIPGQQLVRSTITLCNLVMDGKLHDLDLFGDLQLSILPHNLQELGIDKLVRTSMDALTTFTGFTIFHEFLHTPPLLRDDVPAPRAANLPGSPPRAYLWSQILGLNTEESLKNVNNYAFFATLAKLQDRQWRLAEAEDDWRNGELEQDFNIIVPNNRRSINEPALLLTLPPEERCTDDEKPALQDSGKACLEFRG
ncbi:MAG: hypothetical protein Q9160_000613 [Pyrenula sp. 1 TL-2023]